MTAWDGSVCAMQSEQYETKASEKCIAEWYQQQLSKYCNTNCIKSTRVEEDKASNVLTSCGCRQPGGQRVWIQVGQQDNDIYPCDGKFFYDQKFYIFIISALGHHHQFVPLSSLAMDHNHCPLRISHTVFRWPVAFNNGDGGADDWTSFMLHRCFKLI